MTTYKESGVDIKTGDEFSAYIYSQIKKTWANQSWKEIIIPFDDFSGLRMIKIANFGSCSVMGLNFDGIGTKVEFAELCKDFSTLGYDLLAMVCDDAAVRGAEPVVVGSILDFNKLNIKEYSKQAKDLIDGYVGAAKAANVSIINGEVAELGNRVGGVGDFNFNWGAGCVWFGKSYNLISGKDIKVGDKLVGFREDGFRSNGLSLVRQIIANTCFKFNVTDMYRQILTPSKIYTRAIVDITGGFAKSGRTFVSGMAHITGGGLPGKVGRMLKPTGLGARIDNPFEPPPIMTYMQDVGVVTDREAYKTWNMGQGLVIATSNPEIVLQVADEHNIPAKVIGEIIQEPIIKIKNEGWNRDNIPWLRFP